MRELSVALCTPLAHQACCSWPDVAIQAIPVQVENGFITREARVKVRRVMLLSIEPIHIDHDSKELRDPRHGAPSRVSSTCASVTSAGEIRQVKIGAHQAALWLEKNPCVA